MYQKILKVTSSCEKKITADVLVRIYRDDDCDYFVETSVWFQDQWFVETMSAPSLEMAQAVVRDFSLVSAVDFLDRYAQEAE